MPIESLRDIQRNAVSAFGGGGGGGSFTESATAPGSPSIGDRWLDTDTGIEYTWISPGAWVDLATTGIDFDTFVQITGAQSIAGVKTFTDSPIVPTPTTDMQAATKLYVDSAIVGYGQLAGHRNKIINGAFGINQRGYVSAAATTAGQYTLDRWKVTGTGGITFSTTNNKTTVTIPSGQTLQQVIEGLNLQTGTYVLSWEGTAQGRIAGGAYGASGAVTASITGGTDTTIEFNAGTVSNVQLELGTIATPFEYRQIGAELTLCQRYFCKFSASAGGAYSFANAGAVAITYVDFPVEMRTTPTITAGTLTDSSNGSETSFSALSNLTFRVEVRQGANAGNFFVGRINNQASAEL